MNDIHRPILDSSSFTPNALALSIMLAYSANVLALPAGGVVAVGTANITTGAGATTITQSSKIAVLNWQSFNMASNEAVNFVHPSSSSVTLNRVLGVDPSSILGSLSANGKVFLVNPNGILFGKGASVNVGGLVASTLNIADADLMAGRHLFAGASNAQVVNQGSINAPGAYVALLGANVDNQGVIAARLGSVVLAAGTAVTLDLVGDGLLNVTVNQGAVNALVRNAGLIQADGGQVLMTAQGAGSLLQSVVNNTGVIQAQSLVNHNGLIRLMGDMDGGTVLMGGTLDVSGAATGRTGGSIIATAAQVGLLGGKITASGDAGGGEVLLGGDYQGKNPLVKNATASYMSADSQINADAITQGNGGKVIVWSNGPTRAYGSISARGGAQGGNGGLIETSGHFLDVNGINVKASAPQGQAGTWLLDPNDITIQAAGAETNVTASPNFTSTNDTAVVTTATIETALNAGTSVTVTTGAGGTNAQAGNILVSDTLTYTSVAGPRLTLNALANVTVNSAVTATTGSFVVNAGGNININAATTATTGNLTYKASGNVNFNAATTVTTGTITAVAGGNVAIGVGNPMTVTTGDIVLRGDNDGTGPGAVIGGTVGVNCAANCLTITTGFLRVRFNPVGYASTAAEIANYGTKLTGGGALDAKAWVFGLGDNKVYDGTTTANVSGLKPDNVGVAPAGAVIGAVSNANFDTKNVGVSKLITFGSTFANATFDLFAPLGTTAGTYTTRANITPAPLTVTANNASKLYGQTATLAGTAFTSVGLVNAETVASVTETSPGTVATAAVAGSPYVITPSGATGTLVPGNYTISYVNGALTVTPIPLTVTANNAAKPYGQTATLPVTAFTTTGLVNGDTVTSVTETSPGTVATAAVAGSPYVITPSGATGTLVPGNYTISYVNGALTVTPIPLTVTTNNASKLYGEVPDLSGFTTSPLVNGETVGSVTETSDGQAGIAPPGVTYPITASGATGGTFTPSDYTITYVDGELTVIRLPDVIPPGNPFEALISTPGTDIPIWTPVGASRLLPPELTTLALPPVAPVLVAVPVLAEKLVSVPEPVPVIAQAQAVPVLAEKPVLVLEDTPDIAPIQSPLKIYVAPLRPRKQDRN